MLSERIELVELNELSYLIEQIELEYGASETQKTDPLVLLHGAFSIMQLRLCTRHHTDYR